MDYYNNQTYYDILGVTKDASLENIRAARDRLKYGEDRVSFWKWEEIDKAYDVLSNKEKRREYDRNIGVNQFGGTYFIDSNSNLGSENLSNENFDSSENKENQSDDNDYQSQIQQPSNTTPIENEPENSEENNQTVCDTKDGNETKENLGQPSENGSENSSQSDSSEDNNIDEESEIDETKENLKNNIFKELKFKQNENANFKDFDSINKGKIAKKIAVKIGELAVIGTLGFLVIGLNNAVLFAIGYFTGKKAINKVKKAKLTRKSYTGIITEIQTTESKLIEESNNRLMSNIDKLLQSNYNDAELQKYKLSFENQVELLEKMVENRKNTKEQKGLLTSRELRIQALKGQLNKAKKNLKYIDKNIKRDELIDSIGAENVNLDSKLMRNLTIGNKYLQIKEFNQKIKLQGGPIKSIGNFITSKIAVPDEEEQQSKYR